MAERSTVTQVVNLGAETTPGTAVACNRRLQSMSIVPDPQLEIERFRPQGLKFDTVTALNKDWCSAAISGQPTYDEMQYILSSACDDAAANASETGVYRRIYIMDSDGPDNPRTYTVEEGGSVRAHRFTHGLVTDFTLDFSRDGISLSGSMIGQELADGVTLEAAPVQLPLIPILGSQVSVYSDAAFANLGTTKRTRVLGATLSVGSRYNPLWVLDGSEASWVTWVEGAPDMTLRLLMEADGEGMTFLDRARDAATRFFRVEAVGPLLGATLPYKLRFDVAGKVESSNGFSDEDGVYAVEWMIRGVYDSGWGKAQEFNLWNSRSAL